MHLLQTQPGLISQGDDPIDLVQKPGEILVLSAADTDLSVLNAGLAKIPEDGFPTCRLSSWLQLKHPFSVDMYLERMVPAARVIVVRLLGGKAYWAYGVERLQALEDRVFVAMLGGAAGTFASLGQQGPVLTREIVQQGAEARPKRSRVNTRSRQCLLFQKRCQCLIDLQPVSFNPSHTALLGREAPSKSVTGS